jgi:folate-dependent phosphoribosylglycinamide formyltransferase PurN
MAKQRYIRDSFWTDPYIEKLSPDYICLAGWKQIILDEVIIAYPNKILNLHPGLIPDTIDGNYRNPDDTKALWNKGMLTDKAIKNFLDQKSTFAGSSIHFLTLNFDFGSVLGRTFEEIKQEDDISSLYERLKKKENLQSITWLFRAILYLLFLLSSSQEIVVGKSAPKAPSVSLDDTSKKLGERGETIDQKIAKKWL